MKAKALVLLVLLAAYPAWAQVDRASLAGTVKDASGAVVPGAKVELVSQETGWRREALSSVIGTYSFSLVPVGAYSITASMTGFRSVTIKDVRLGVGDNRNLNIEMTVSATDTQVTVESVLEPAG